MDIVAAKLPLHQLRSDILSLQELPNISEHRKEEESDGAARGDWSCAGNSTVWVSVDHIFYILYFILCAFLFLTLDAPAAERSGDRKLSFFLLFLFLTDK